MEWAYWELTINVGLVATMSAVFYVLWCLRQTQNELLNRAKKAESERDYYKQLWLQSTNLTFGEKASPAIIEKYQLKD